jgi:hypothetical protein
MKIHLHQNSVVNSPCSDVDCRMYLPGAVGSVRVSVCPDSQP